LINFTNYIFNTMLHTFFFKVFSNFMKFREISEQS
jgi:hypothetical protein